MVVTVSGTSVMSLHFSCQLGSCTVRLRALQGVLLHLVLRLVALERGLQGVRQGRDETTCLLLCSLRRVFDPNKPNPRFLLPVSTESGALTD
ncbi:hypothetical protein EYF80_040594 [Liparis tanakae]|uniref:Uncharacterized protein n=1 Tax=Liparis tanakae TaxID=230148 RepID=A0A4Z2G6N0_9TELE|nr:hypothetical protein EYF80_040594 [Liparis tanakae]